MRVTMEKARFDCLKKRQEVARFVPVGDEGRSRYFPMGTPGCLLPGKMEPN